jgi:hypothetical protein
MARGAVHARGDCILGPEVLETVAMIKEAVERLMDQARGANGFIMLNKYSEEYVLVRRNDIQLLLATWGEKKNT